MSARANSSPGQLVTLGSLLQQFCGVFAAVYVTQ